jgi:hypothetical protein
VPGDNTRLRRFIEIGPRHLDGERRHRPAAKPRGHRRHQARIDPAAQIADDWNISTEPPLDRRHENVLEPIDKAVT